MAADQGDRITRMLEQLPGMDHQKLLTLRENAVRFGDEALPLVVAIDDRLADFESAGGMAKHRLDFARQMMQIAMRSPRTWIASRDLFNKARVEFAHNPFVVWMTGNSARQIPLTKALETVRSEFPRIEYRKDGTGQSDRIYYRYLP